MKNTLLLLALGTALATTTIGCGDDDGGGGGSSTGGSGTGNSGTGNSGTGNSGTGNSGTGAGSTGGSGTGGSGTGGAGGAVGGGGGTAGGGGTGGMKYAFCGDCTTNAPNDECNAERIACEANADCNQIKNDSFNQCTSDEAGACCTLDIQNANGDPAAIALFRAFDDCLYCQTCLNVCSNAPEYCAVFPDDPGGVCP